MRPKCGPNGAWPDAQERPTQFLDCPQHPRERICRRSGDLSVPQRCDLRVNTQGRSRRFSLLATVVIAAAAIHLAVIALTLLVTDRFAQADILLASFWILPVTWTPSSLLDS